MPPSGGAGCLPDTKVYPGAGRAGSEVRAGIGRYLSFCNTRRRRTSFGQWQMPDQALPRRADLDKVGRIIEAEINLEKRFKLSA